MLSAFESAPGPQFCVRRTEVVEHVARELGGEVVNNALFAEIEAAARALGWQPIRNGQRRLFRSCKRREFDCEQALAASRQQRSKGVRATSGSPRVGG